MVPVDGNMTLDLDGMMEVITALKAPVISPCTTSSPTRSTGSSARAKEKWQVEVGANSPHRGIEGDAPEEPEGAGAAGALSLAFRSHEVA